MSFALDCIKPTVAKSDCDSSTEGHSNGIHTRRSFSTGKISIPKSIYFSLKREKPILPSFVSENNVIKDTTLTRVARPNQQNERRKEISLNLWIQEAKNVPAKKRYFCEVYLDGGLYARTTTKTMGDMLFWGEEFNLCNLDEVNVVALLLWRCGDESRSKKKKSQQQLVCQVNISTREIDQRTSVEKWYSASSSTSPNCDATSSPDTPTSHLSHSILSSTSAALGPLSQSVHISSLTTPVSPCSSSTVLSSGGEHVPMLRVKARYQHLDVLPLCVYADLITFLNDNTVRILAEIEPYLKVKAKEDLAQNLIRIIHKQGSAVPILCDLIINEINKSDDKNLILRGNTMASKAMEIYLKLIGEKYLHLTLSDFINRVLLGQDDCEVDPQKDRVDLYPSSSSVAHSSPSLDKGAQQYTLQQRQESLMMNVEMIWAKIMSSYIYFPKDLKTVFVTLRQRLHGSKACQSYGNHGEDQPDICDRIISACIFLRYICPAILTPSLFGLIPEYPDNAKVTRTFTLVAKCIQTLANFSNLSGTKESYMVFMNTFIENNFKTMRDFLREISDSSSSTENGRRETKCDSIPGSTSDSKEYLYWENLSSNLPEDSIDLALCLATLHRQLEDCLLQIAPSNINGTIKTLQIIIRDINVRLKNDDGAAVAPIKISHSYQNIRSQAPQTHPEQYPKRISLDTQDYVSRGCYNDPSIGQGDGTNKPGKHTRSGHGRVVNNCHSAESTPTHQVSDKCMDYLMTQSMVTDTDGGSTPRVAKVTAVPVSGQVDREWRAVLSASYLYNHGSETAFFAQPSAKTQYRPVQGSTASSSGYQTLSRSSDSLERSTGDELLVLPKSPTSSLKPSVKKCKQARRQTDLITSRFDTSVSPSQPINSKINIKEATARSVSSEEIRLLLSRPQQEDVLDSSSTQTLTAISVAMPQPDVVVPGMRPRMTSSMSMPVVHSVFDCPDVNQHPGMFSAFQAFSVDDGGMQTKSSQMCLDPIITPTNGRSAFRDTTAKYRPSPSNHSARTHPDPLPTTPTAISDTEKMKCSLNSLRQTLNSRMKQLLLADRTTIQLELERVRLMRRICDTSATNGTTLATSLLLFSDWGDLSYGSVAEANQRPVNAVPITKYLDLAEDMLTKAFQGRARPRTSHEDSNMEDLLVQIFQTNQSLQNTLMARPDSEVGQQTTVCDEQQISHCHSRILHVQPARVQGHSSYAIRHHGSHGTKAHSLGSLTQSSQPSATSSASSAKIEISLDAV